MNTSCEYVNKNGTDYIIQRTYNTQNILVDFSEFIGDTRVGLHKKYYDNGNLEFIRTYNNQGHFQNETRYRQDGSVVSTEVYNTTYNGNYTMRF